MTEAPTLPLDGQLCYSIYAASLAIQRAYKPMLDELGVTYTQYLVLSALWEVDGLTIDAIGERSGLEPSTITVAVKRI
jgi:MarR family transcriptional regulator, organic hydroperoxide resistance regulator